MSPLRWFRRHATWMLIIFGVVLMAIFGLGPVFDNMARGFQSSGTQIEDPVVIKYRGGEITRSKLDTLQRNHFSTQRFLSQLMEQAAKQCEDKEVQFSPLARMIPPLGRTNDQDVVDEQMLVRKLLADRAEDEGVVISEGMIDDYLSLIVGQAEFSPREWSQINKLANQRTSMSTIRNHLMLELKAMQMQRYVSIGVPLNPVPTEAVELYGRANNRIECEVIPVSVEEYIGKVSGEPSRAEMQALFEEGKYDYEDIRKQEPGFKVPRKVNVQYFVAEMETFLQIEKSKLTDAEVEAEYEKLVAAEDPIVVDVIAQPDPEGFDLDFGTDTDPLAPGTDPDDTDGEDAKMKDGDGEKIDLDAEVPVLDMPESKTEEPAVPDPKKLIDETPEKPADELKVTPAEDKKDQSSIVSGVKSQFVSFVQEETEEEQKPAADGEVEDKQEGEKEESNEVGGIADLQLSDESAGPQTEENTKKTRIKPLSEVADEIRVRIARAAAFKKKDEATKRAMIAMQTYQNEVLRWETSRDRDVTEKPPVPDFEAIAKENGLVFKETGLVDPFELRDTAIGKVQFPEQVQSPQGPVSMRLQSVGNKIFLDFDRIDLLVPQDMGDIITGDAYVYWMAEKVDVRIPTLNESEEKVKEYWKYQQAVDLAKQAAQKMADNAKAQGKKLTELFPTTAAPTGEFTWFIPGQQSAQAVYGRPFGIESPGEEFMSTAFGLDEKETGVAANEPRDTVYVIQRITPPASVADLGQEYLNQQYFRFKRVPTDVMGTATHYAQEMEFDWRDEFVKTMELKRMK